MNYKMIGAICVICGCGSCGFIMASQYVSSIRLYRHLVAVLNYMQCELSYRSTPLPHLCRQAGMQVSGKINAIFSQIADELDSQLLPDVSCCVSSVLNRMDSIDNELRMILLDLSNSLGKFDVSGQLKALERSKDQCMEKLGQLQRGKETRVRSYQTLGLCAGAAIAILFV